MALEKFKSINWTSSNENTGMDRVLYVEDEDSNWNVTELHLRGKYILKRARDAREAFKILKEERFDLILLDIQLAGSDYDGIEICKILRQLPGQLIPNEARGLDYRDVPVVFVTAYAEQHTRAMLKKAGGDDVITKPVDFVRLKLVSSRLLIRNYTEAPKYP
jgi:CheY-like chemotaxis protein